MVSQGKEEEEEEGEENAQIRGRRGRGRKAMQQAAPPRRYVPAKVSEAARSPPQRGENKISLIADYGVEDYANRGKF